MDSELETRSISWYDLLYYIGAHFMKMTQTYTSNRSLDPSLDERSDILSKVFCGYWILTTIANVNDNSHT